MSKTKLVKVDRNDLLNEFMTPFDRLIDQMFQVISPELSVQYGPSFFEKGAYPKVDVIDTTTAVVIEAAIPGMSKEDISINVNNDVLTISGEKQNKDKKPVGNFVHRELKKSSFRRSWVLPEQLNKEKISAKFDNGMLYISIEKLKPDEEKEKVRQIKID